MLNVFYKRNSNSEGEYTRAYLGEDAMQSFNIWFPDSSFILFGAFLHADAKNCNWWNVAFSSFCIDSCEANVW